MEYSISKQQQPLLEPVTSDANNAGYSVAANKQTKANLKFLKNSRHIESCGTCMEH
jgi:hypothetical protein